MTNGASPSSIRLTAGLRRTLRGVAEGTPLPRRVKTLLEMASLAERGLIVAEKTPDGLAYTRWVVTPAGRTALGGAS